MKFFMSFVLLFSTAASATSLGQFISSPEGSSFQKFEVNGAKVEYEKLSNFFDKKKDLTLGKYSSTYALPEKDQAKIATTLSKIKDVDEFMKKKNSSFNDLSTKNPHQSFIILDGYRIAQESDLYSDMKMIFDSLMSQDWKQQSGIKLSDDYKNVMRVRDGKEVSKEAFDFAFHCKNAEPPSICTYKEFGVLFIPKK